MEPGKGLEFDTAKLPSEPTLRTPPMGLVTATLGVLGALAQPVRGLEAVIDIALGAMPK
jgi:hypothetical protein